MMNDTVREQARISASTVARVGAKSAPLPGHRAPPPPAPNPDPVVPRKRVTASLASHKTSPTLVDFKNKNTSLPDWRLQLQNAVQQRKGGHEESAAISGSNAGDQSANIGPAKLRAEAMPLTNAETPAEISDPRVASAMRRIAESRSAFLETETKPKKPAQMRPFGVVSSNNSGSAVAMAPARVNTVHTPKLVTPPPVVEKRDTNKLPRIEPLPETVVISPKPVIVKVEKVENGPLSTEFPKIKRIQIIKTENIEIDPFQTREIESDEIEDLAPFSMRFGAGLFDLIISGFATMLILSPLAFTSGNWLTATGLLTFAATWGAVTFLYMTICLGFFGKTMGMRLFLLELVDAVENEYPTLRQAALNSLIFIVMLPFFGAGFLAAIFNEEKRALHDLLSGTILVREF